MAHVKSLRTGGLLTIGLALLVAMLLGTSTSTQALPAGAGGGDLHAGGMYYLGIGEAVPPSMLVAGTGQLMPWVWKDSMTSSARYSYSEPCSARTDVFGDCSTKTLDSFGGDDRRCSTAAISGEPTQVKCTSWAVPGGGFTVFCSSTPGIGGGGTFQICSTAQTSRNTFCSAEQTEAASSGNAHCSAFGQSQPSGGAAAYCSAEGADQDGGNASNCSAYNTGGGQGTSFCSAGAGSQPSDQCSVIAGSGNTCTAAAGSGTQCSTTAGAGGQCSSFSSWGGGLVQTGNSCQ